MRLPNTKKLAKTKHPDRDGGNTVEFQILQGSNAACPLRKVWGTIHKWKGGKTANVKNAYQQDKESRRNFKWSINRYNRRRNQDRTEFIQRILSETIENCGHSELDPTENDPNIEMNYQCGECGLMFESGNKSLALIYIL